MTPEEELLVLRKQLSELKAERERMLPIYEAHLLATRRAAENRERERLRVEALTEHERHCEWRHPDYEYTVTYNARKSGEDARPPGDGWEANDIVTDHQYSDGLVVEKRWCNWRRGEYTEANYWRRRIGVD